MLLLGGLALAGGLTKKKAEEPTPAATTPPVEAAPPPTPPLFAGGLPVALEQVPAGLGNLSAQGCHGCHVQAHDQWESSPHASSWNEPRFQAAMARVGQSTACKACHLPLTNQHPRVAAGYREGDLTRPELVENPIWDATLMREGVTCAACHVRGDTVVSTRETPGAPHKVTVSKELGESAFCANCHQLTWPGAKSAFYDTFGEYEASPYPKAGVRCQDCHMPLRTAEATAGRFAAAASHSAPVDLSRGLSVLLKLPKPEIQRGEAYPVEITLQNTGAGHKIPTGSPFVSLRVQVELLGADGKPIANPGGVELARRITEAPPWDTLSDDRLAPGQERKFVHNLDVSQKVPSQAATLRIAVYRLHDGDLDPTEATALVQEWPLSVL